MYPCMELPQWPSAIRWSQVMSPSITTMHTVNRYELRNASRHCELDHLKNDELDAGAERYKIRFRHCCALQLNSDEERDNGTHPCKVIRCTSSTLKLLHLSCGVLPRWHLLHVQSQSRSRLSSYKVHVTRTMHGTRKRKLDFELTKFKTQTWKRK